MNYLLEALCKKLEGEMAVAYANVKAYERNVVGIGEHPDIVAAIEIEVAKIGRAEGMLKTIHNHFGNGYEK